MDELIINPLILEDTVLVYDNETDNVEEETE